MTLLQNCRFLKYNIICQYNPPGLSVFLLLYLYCTVYSLHNAIGEAPGLDSNPGDGDTNHWTMPNILISPLFYLRSSLLFLSLDE